MTTWTAERARIASLCRSRPPNDPDLLAARRALALARTEARIREAIEQAPPLDAETLRRIRDLIPPAPTEAGGPDA